MYINKIKKEKKKWQQKAEGLFVCCRSVYHSDITARRWKINIKDGSGSSFQSSSRLRLETDKSALNHKEEKKKKKKNTPNALTDDGHRRLVQETKWRKKEEGKKPPSDCHFCGQS